MIGTIVALVVGIPLCLIGLAMLAYVGLTALGYGDIQGARE